MRWFLIVFLILPYLVEGQTVCTPESRERLGTTLNRLSKLDLSNRSMNEVALEIGGWFLGTPYVGKTLELTGEEQLVVNLMGLDCTTYLETVVALTRIAMQKDFTFEAYQKELELIRYQEGTRMAYPSRLHYFSDWIYQNQEKGILKDITKTIGGVTYENAPSFMSANPNFYSQLTNPDYVAQLRTTEEAISNRTYYYIPKEDVFIHEKNIKPGDLIAITTTISDLDIVHVGFAIKRNGRIHLLHASTNSMKVEVSSKPLHHYLKDNKSQSGIMVARLESQY
ncbi:N-acetylmuramoyl-L-alanine amidase-like domain-containing protein [uncultured Cyclobacterium sp.]|uniref:N-acetylmuramoyl-L-alanine amidase-like domain-containing protein n=1 Tax=uncultured Cyclobacterium sp. TaxID=453820 RepID=UPI0030EEBDA2|tara:strand:- start:3697 stop:4542 length:846 start_codon:yes stop_codon:yes gene_type:complete